jgi:hypothetical protein
MMIPHRQGKRKTLGHPVHDDQRSVSSDLLPKAWSQPSKADQLAEARDVQVHSGEFAPDGIR